MSSVLITGAGRGYGHALTETFSRRKWRVFSLVRNRGDAARLMHSTGSRINPIIADLQSDNLENAVTDAVSTHGGSLDILINNGGNIYKHRGIENTSLSEFDELFQVHVIGAFRCARAALPFLEKSERPVIVNVSSRWGSITRTDSGRFCGIYSYHAAKAAQNMLSVCLNHELESKRIRVFAVHPGRLTTESGAPDADTDPHDAAEKLADWLKTVDHDTPCGLHDLMSGRLLPW